MHNVNSKLALHGRGPDLHQDDDRFISQGAESKLALHGSGFDLQPVLNWIQYQDVEARQRLKKGNITTLLLHHTRFDQGVILHHFLTNLDFWLNLFIKKKV